MTELLIAPCSNEALKLAVTKYHYSHTVPGGQKIGLGVWEDKQFKGAIVFTRGCRNQYKEFTPYHKGGTIELSRVALGNHILPVTQIIKKAIQYIKKTHTHTELIISYADLNQNHAGTIYQAGNWIYLGKIETQSYMLVLGEKKHTRSVFSKYGHRGLKWIHEHVDPDAKMLKDKGRYKYAYPLTKKMRKKLLPLQKEYPKL